MKKILLTLLCLTCLLADAEPAPSTNTPAPAITLESFKLVGDLNGERAAFTFSAVARVENPKGGSLDLLSGMVALTEVAQHKDWRVRAESNRFVLIFDRNGTFPIRVKFNAAVRQSDNWKAVDFRVAGTAVQPIVLQGLSAETKFEFAGAARPERRGDDFVSYLPADGSVKLAWKEARAEMEGKLFYSAEMLSQLTVSPGLMRQNALMQFKVMQGELNRVTLVLRGEG
jgi:hypothetical protein